MKAEKKKKQRIFFRGLPAHIFGMLREILNVTFLFRQCTALTVLNVL